MPSRKLPSHLIIGPVRYEIQVVNIPDEDVGKCSQLKTRIRLQKGMSEEQTVAVSLHEALHGINFEHSVPQLLGLHSKDEERLVSILAPALLAFIRNNPEYIDFIKGGSNGRTRTRSDRAVQERRGSRDAGDRDACVEPGRGGQPGRVPAARSRPAH